MKMGKNIKLFVYMGTVNKNINNKENNAVLFLNNKLFGKLHAFTNCGSCRKEFLTTLFVIGKKHVWNS